jgi:sugar-specific transcriptional regulator TrmB
LASVELGEKTLRELGLTLSQARVYLALVKSGKHSTAKAVSVFSKVARQDVYRTLTELRDLSLVEKVIGNPTLFRAIPLQETIAILMERKNQRTHELLVEATELIKLFAVDDVSKPHQENHQFILIPKKEALIRRIKKVVEGAQKSILIISPWRELTQWLFILHESWEQALKRGVKVKWITEKQEDQHLVTEITRALIKDPNFTLRTEPTSSMSRFGVYDGKEVFITISSTPNATKSPAFWTNNPTITFILKDYFEIKWQLSTQYNLNILIS